MSNPTVLVLDDSRERLKAFRSQLPFADCVETAAEAIALLQQDFTYDYLFLDHDLGGETYTDSSLPETGMEVVRHLVANPQPIRAIVVHSLNDAARIEMREKLRAAGYNAYAGPFAWEAAARVIELVKEKEQDVQHE